MKHLHLSASIALCMLLNSTSAIAQTFHFDPDERVELTKSIEQDTYGTVTSVLILQSGQSVYESYFNGSDAETLHNTRSTTKTITGMVVGAAVQHGHLSLDEPVAGLFSELAPFQNPDARKFEVTVEDLLTMSSALECDDWNEHSRGNEERMYIVEDWNAFYWNLPIKGYPSWKPTPEQSKYGRAFSYCTAGVQLLGEVIERKTGQDFAAYANEQLFSPLGVSDFEWQTTGAGTLHLGGGLLLSSQELAKFGELQRQNGKQNDEQLYSVEWAQTATKPHAQIPDTPFDYGYLWWLVPYTVDDQQYIAASMMGNGGNRVMVLPEFDLTVVFTNTDFNTPTMHQNANAFFQNEIISRLSKS